MTNKELIERAEAYLAQHVDEPDLSDNRASALIRQLLAALRPDIEAVERVVQKEQFTIDCTNRKYVGDMQAVLYKGVPAYYINLSHPEWNYIQSAMADFVDRHNNPKAVNGLLEQVEKAYQSVRAIYKCIHHGHPTSSDEGAEESYMAIHADIADETLKAAIQAMQQGEV